MEVRVGVRFSVRFPRLLMKFSSQKMRIDRFHKILGTKHFGSVPVLTELTEFFQKTSGQQKNIRVLRQIYATLYSFLILIMYKKTIAI
jgi:hypothetical protein